MKTALICLLATLFAGGPASAADTPAQAPQILKVKIAVPERGAVVAIDEHSHFHVVIENVSTEPQPIIDEWNSWGYFNLTFEYTAADGQRHVMEKRPRAWKGNELTASKLMPGEVEVRDVFLNDQSWSNLPVPARGETKIRIRAVFQQKLEGFNIPGLWQGRIESPELELTFRKAG